MFSLWDAFPPKDSASNIPEMANKEYLPEEKGLETKELYLLQKLEMKRTTYDFAT